MAGQARDHNPGQHEEAGIIGQPLEITFPRGAIPAEEGVAVRAFPRCRAEQRARHRTAVSVPHQIPQVLAHRIAVAEVVRLEPRSAYCNNITLTADPPAPTVITAAYH